MEKLFSIGDLTEIKNDAEIHLSDYLGALIVNGEATERTIITVTRNKHLIFVEGNSDTGYQHLKDRHGAFSLRNYWVNLENGIKLDNPSKFHPKMMPFVDYVKIAEAVFSEENKSPIRNKHPDQFDKFTGYYNYTGKRDELYHLLTYKDTKIVHTLFPDKKRYNRKRNVKLGKGIVKTELRFPIGYNDLIVPYENEKGIAVYSILIRKYYSEQIERTFIQKHNAGGVAEDEAYFLSERPFDGFERFDRELMYRYQYTDLVDYERIISQIDIE